MGMTKGNVLLLLSYTAGKISGIQREIESGVRDAGSSQVAFSVLCVTCVKTRVLKKNKIMRVCPGEELFVIKLEGENPCLYVEKLVSLH